MKGIMIQGTSSDSGKSFIATAFCRIFSNMGRSVCPFKSQNMSNNSYVTRDGYEIGRAQGVQAEAARVEAETFMNPILLKPRGDTFSEIVLMGKVHGTPCDRNYYRDFTMGAGLDALRSALALIGEKFEMIVAEGAGSPAEINLNQAEIANMRVAREADLPVILVTDVDRGGSLASVVGTLELLGEDRARVKGIIFNKFRGDPELFRDAMEWTEQYTGVKVLGVVPWINGLVIEGEDVLSINWAGSPDGERALTIGAVRLPRISNHTDLEAFRFEPDVKVVEIDSPGQIAGLDAIVIPGTKSTVSDMKYLTESGLAAEIKRFSGRGGHVFGICGGYQMMGKRIADPEHIDDPTVTEIAGLGLLPLETVFRGGKTTKRRSGRAIHPAITIDCPVSGYEIHFGRERWDDDSSGFSPLFELDGAADGAADLDIRTAGTYLHNVFHNDAFRGLWLNKIRESKGLAPRPAFDSARAKEDAYERLADVVSRSVDVEYVTRTLLDWRQG